MLSMYQSGPSIIFVFPSVSLKYNAVNEPYFVSPCMHKILKLKEVVLKQVDSELDR